MRYVNKNKRQFIAGAICSHCKAQDTTVVITTETTEHSECVACNHTEKRPTPESLKQTTETLMENSQTSPTVGIVRFK